MSMEEIWVMDSDLCEECGGLVDDFGICLKCGHDGIGWDEYDDTEEREAWYYDDTEEWED